jgi:hypothetical protein
MVPTKLLLLLLNLLKAPVPAAANCDGLLPLLLLMRWPGLLFLLLA